MKGIPEAWNNGVKVLLLLTTIPPSIIAVQRMAILSVSQATPAPTMAMALGTILPLRRDKVCLRRHTIKITKEDNTKQVSVHKAMLHRQRQVHIRVQIRRHTDQIRAISLLNLQLHIYHTTQPTNNSTWLRPARVIKAGMALILILIPRTPASPLAAPILHHSALVLEVKILRTQIRVRTSLDSRTILDQVGDLSVGPLRRLQTCIANTVIHEISKGHQTQPRIMLIESQVATTANAVTNTVLEDSMMHDATSVLRQPSSHPPSLKHLGSIMLGAVAAVLRALTL